jgi:sulfite reductase beta subunit-like hemoprotein
VFQLNLKNVSMEEAARVLAATSRYQSYTDPSIAKQKITIENLGTIDELARLIERKAQVQVVVDHAGREVRFLPATGEPPKLFSE